MTNAKLFRASGLAVLIGAVAFIAHIVARSAITANTGGETIAFASHSLWVPINALGVFGGVLVLAGMPALYARMADASGLTGLIGISLLALGWLFFGVFLSFYSMVVVPWLAENAPQLVDMLNQYPPMLIAFGIALLAEVVGSVLLAVPFLRGAARPAWVGYVLIAAAVMTIGGIFVAPAGPETNLAVNLFSNLGPVLLMLALGALGFRMWEAHGAAAPRRAPVHA
ncbi:MAG: hypothetical protein AB7P40_31930 [Chloroflexota bacterium]